MLLVHARTGPESSEPLVAVCRTEAEAREVEHAVEVAGSDAELRWETHYVVWSRPVGWRRPDWPFDPSAPARSDSERG